MIMFFHCLNTARAIATQKQTIVGLKKMRFMSFPNRTLLMGQSHPAKDKVPMLLVVLTGVHLASILPPQIARQKDKAESARHAKQITCLLPGRYGPRFIRATIPRR
jgi:hypothetical protein